MKDQSKLGSKSRRRFLQTVAAGSLGLLAQTGRAETTKTLPARGDVVPAPPSKTVVEVRVHVNQVGYLPGEPKRAVVAATGSILGDGFVVVDDAVVPTIRHQGTLKEYQPPSDSKSGHSAQHFFADFDKFNRPGRYRLRLSDGHLSVPFTVGSTVYAQMTPLILQYFDVQRCGLQSSQHRGPCHTDDGILSGGPRSGQPLDASGGWHDAGDYLKFVETTSYVAALLLFAYDNHAPRYSRAQPAGGLPLLLAAARVGLDWLLKMHPHPDEFYYQVGDDTDHNSWRLPEQDTAKNDPNWKPRPVFYGVGANLAGRTAAALALASRLYRPYDPAYADHCLLAAKSVFALGLKNPKVVSTKPADFYPETTWQDDMEWGAAALYRATKQPEYLGHAQAFSRLAGSADAQVSVYDTHALAHFTLYPHVPAADQKRLLGYLQSDVQSIEEQAATSAYGLGTSYVWGTAEAAAGAAISCLLYAKLSGDTHYADIARRQRDFILGCNPFSLCCLVGAGTIFPLFPHHQIANLKNIELTGAVVGGPADLETYQAQHISLSKTEFASQSPSPILMADRPDQISVYHDAVEDYVTNEPANDYTANFLLLTAYYLEEPK